MKNLKKLKLKDATLLKDPQMKVVTGGYGGAKDTCSGKENNCGGGCFPGGVLTESGVCYMEWGNTCLCKNYRDL